MQPLGNCTACPLRGRPCAPTVGPENSKVIIVSRSPAYHEGLTGVPFSGPSGKVLDHLLKQNEVNRAEIRLTNVVLCVPEEGQLPKEAIAACSHRLHSEIKSADLVIAAGSEAVRAILGRGSIDSARGYIHERRLPSGKIQQIVATNNPALVLRDAAHFPNLVRDFRRAFHPLPKPTLPRVQIASSLEQAIQIVKGLLNAQPSYIGVDTESRGGLTHKADIVCIQFSLDGEIAWVLPEDIIRDVGFREQYLRPLLESQHRFIWHNGKWDVKLIQYGWGIQAHVDEDTMLLSYALDERSGEGAVHSLDYLLMEEFGWPNYEPASVKKFKKDGIIVDPTALYTYAGWDAAGTRQLYTVLSQRAETEKCLKVYQSVLLPASAMLRQMELNGIIYDIDRACDLFEEELKPELDQLIATMRKITGNPILNPNSPQQVGRLFYDVWKIDHVMRQRPDKDRSVDKAARKEILENRYTLKGEVIGGEKQPQVRADIKQFVTAYHRFKKLTKQASTYIVGMVEKASTDPEQRIYTNFKLHGTNSGRLSSANPNLQNITREYEDLPSIRALFKPSPGRVFVEADYSQAELRVIAYLSSDPELTRIYNEGLDLHNIAAERFYGPNYTKAQRSRAKNMNFGVAYRQTAQTFQEKHGIPESEGSKFIKWWWATFTGVAEWEKDIEQIINTSGILDTPFGRKRRFYLITKENQQASYREGIDFYPQSIASDFTLTSAIILAGELDPAKAKLVLTVHDSLLDDVVEDYADEAATITKQVMENQPRNSLGWTLPFEVKMSFGPSWGECK